MILSSVKVGHAVVVTASDVVNYDVPEFISVASIHARVVKRIVAIQIPSPLKVRNSYYTG